MPDTRKLARHCAEVYITILGDAWVSLKPCEGWTQIIANSKLILISTIGVEDGIALLDEIVCHTSNAILLPGFGSGNFPLSSGHAAYSRARGLISIAP
jgi:hypothetical protein